MQSETTRQTIQESWESAISHAILEHTVPPLELTEQVKQVAGLRVQTTLRVGDDTGTVPPVVITQWYWYTPY